MNTRWQETVLERLRQVIDPETGADVVRMRHALPSTGVQAEKAGEKQADGASTCLKPVRSSELP